EWDAAREIGSFRFGLLGGHNVLPTPRTILGWRQMRGPPRHALCERVRCTQAVRSEQPKLISVPARHAVARKQSLLCRVADSWAAAAMRELPRNPRCMQTLPFKAWFEGDSLMANPRSTASIAGHPIHPMLIPFPI